MPEPFAAARQAVEHAIAARLFPAASVDVGTSAGSLWTDAFGTLTFDAGAARAELDTVFDLASLTKVVSTTTILMDLVRLDRVRLDDPVSRYVPEWQQPDRVRVTIEDLLEHASGLPPRLVAATPQSRRQFQRDISGVPLDYTPRTQSVYSDLDFILLGFLAADFAGTRLATVFDALYRGWESPHEALTFDVLPSARDHVAPTLPLPGDIERRGRVLVGEVQDDYAAVLGGAAGHAGLFGTARAVGHFARLILGVARGAVNAPSPFRPDLVERFTRKTTVPGSSRALGWDTMLPTSSCGTRMSAAAFGHVGFTGTSLWIDPARDRYFVLLSNRAYGGGSLDDMRALRRAFHDALGDL